MIGDNVMIAEYFSIRDSAHNFSQLDIPMSYQGETSRAIVIHDDVWIGRGCAIL